MKKIFTFYLLLFISNYCFGQVKDSIPNTVVSGIYEAIIATNNAQHHIKYFAEFYLLKLPDNPCLIYVRRPELRLILNSYKK